MNERNLEGKLKVINSTDMPKVVLDALLSETFHGDILNHNHPETSQLGNLFRGREILLVTYPLQCDSGHGQWAAQHWYEEKGLKPDEYFVLRLDIDQVTDHLKQYWRVTHD